MASHEELQAWHARLADVLPVSVATAGKVAGEQTELSRAAFLATVRELAPRMTDGAGFQRTIARDVQTAVRMFAGQRGDEAAYWLGEAVWRANAS